MTQDWDSGFWDLDGVTPLSWERGARLLCDPEMRDQRTLARTALFGEGDVIATITTMFMVIDPGSDRTPPWLWECSVRGGPKDVAGASRRYPTAAEARDGHNAMTFHVEMGYTRAGVAIVKKTFWEGPLKAMMEQT